MAKFVYRPDLTVPQVNTVLIPFAVKTDPCTTYITLAPCPLRSGSRGHLNFELTCASDVATDSWCPAIDRIILWGTKRGRLAACSRRIDLERSTVKCVADFLEECSTKV